MVEASELLLLENFLLELFGNYVKQHPACVHMAPFKFTPELVEQLIIAIKMIWEISELVAPGTFSEAACTSIFMVLTLSDIILVQAPPNCKAVALLAGTSCELDPSTIEPFRNPVTDQLFHLDR